MAYRFVDVLCLIQVTKKVFFDISIGGKAAGLLPISAIHMQTFFAVVIKKSYVSFVTGFTRFFFTASLEQTKFQIHKVALLKQTLVARPVDVFDSVSQFPV